MMTLTTKASVACLVLFFVPYLSGVHGHSNLTLSSPRGNTSFVNPVYYHALTASFTATACISLIGNGLVIHVVRTTPSMFSSVNVFIANMAISDVISTIFGTPVMVKQLAGSYHWFDGKGGLILCKIIYFIFYCSFACSTFNHMAIAIDRYLAVSKPMFRYSQRTIKIVVIMSWLVSSIISIPIANGYNDKSYKPEVDTMCYDSNRDLSYDLSVTLMAIMCYGIPLITVTTLYAITGYKLRMRTKKTIGANNRSRQQQASKAAYKATKLMITVVTVFGLCWAPFFTYHLIKAWYQSTNKPLYKLLLRWLPRPVSFLLAATNAAINPCLYFIFSANFRNELIRLMGSCTKPTQHWLNIELQTRTVGNPPKPTQNCIRDKGTKSSP